MAIASALLVGLVALEHLYFLILEMFLWSTPGVMKTFGNTKESAQATRVLAGNQGLYNGFLVAGLVWGLAHPDPATAVQIRVFFLGCVLVAGLYGGMTAKRSILWIQGVPGLIALAAVLLARI